MAAGREGRAAEELAAGESADGGAFVFMGYSNLPDFWPVAVDLDQSKLIRQGRKSYSIRLGRISKVIPRGGSQRWWRDAPILLSFLSFNSRLRASRLSIAGRRGARPALSQAAKMPVIAHDHCGRRAIAGAEHARTRSAARPAVRRGW